MRANLAALGGLRIDFGLARSRGFLVLAMVPIMLGVAAATTIFSVADGVFLRPFPYPQPERLYVVGSAWQPGELSGLSIPIYVDMRGRVDGFETFGLLMGIVGLNRRHDDGATERVQAVRVADDVFELLGARTVIGRLPDVHEFSVAVLSHEEWLASWGGNDSALGRAVTLSGETFTVVGVLNPDFVPPEGIIFGSADPDYWVPLNVDDPSWERTRSFGAFWALGRLAEGTSLETAQDQLDAVGASLVDAYPDDNTRDGGAMTLALRGLHAHTVGTSRDRVALLLAAVGLLLVISCTNVASLFLVRVHQRAGDLALRAALGAGRARLAAFVIGEGLAVALLGGILGGALAHAGVEAFVALSPGDIPRLAEIRLDARALAFATAASALTALLATAVPAVHATRRPPGDVLRSTSITTTWASGRLHTTLMGLQTALVVVLLSAAAVFMRGFVGLAYVDHGFDPAGVLSIELATTERVPESFAAIFRGVAERIREVPGVTSVSGGSLSPTEPMEGLWEVGIPPMAAEQRTATNIILPDWFGTLGIPFVAGSDFSWAHDADSPPAVVVSERLARELFGRVDVVGAELALSDEGFARPTIVGVVADTMQRTAGGRHEAARALYIPYLQRPFLGRMIFAVRHDEGLLDVVPAVRDAVRRAGPAVTLVSVDTLSSVMSRTLVEPRFYSWLLTAFSLVAVTIVSFGIYAALAFLVAGRRREIGVRVALGASPERVLGSIVGHALLIVGGGLAVGLPVALHAASYLGGLIAGIDASGLLPHVVSASILVLLAGVAAIVPARRALRIQPIRVLSTD